MVQFCYLRLYLGIETVSCRLLQRMARMDMDWNLKGLDQLKIQGYACTQKIIMLSALWWNLFAIFSITLQELHLCMGKDTK